MISVNPLFADFCIITAFYLSLSMNSLFLCCAGAFCLSVQKTAIVIVSNVYYIVCLVFFSYFDGAIDHFILFIRVGLRFCPLNNPKSSQRLIVFNFPSMNLCFFLFRLRLIAYFSAITRKLSSHLIFFIQCPFYSYF